MANTITPLAIRRIAEPGQTITQQFTMQDVSSGMVSATIEGDPIFRIRQIFGTRLGEPEQLSDEELDQLPRHVREDLEKNGFRPTIEFTSGPGQPLAVDMGNNVRGVIECAIPAEQPAGTLQANVNVIHSGVGTVTIPFTLSIGGAVVEPLVRPVVARRGQAVKFPVQINLPPGTPAVDVRLEYNHEHVRIETQVVHVEAGGSATVQLNLVTDQDAPLITLPSQAMFIGGVGTGGFQDTMLFDVVIADPAKLTARLQQSKVAAVRGGSFRASIEFTPEPGYSPDVSLNSEMPEGVREVVRSVSIAGPEVVPVDFAVELQAQPIENAPAAIDWRTHDGTNFGRLDLQVIIDQSAVRGPLNAIFQITEIHCVDEGDGPGTAEPYLWVLFFKLDGEMVAMDSANLSGKVRLQRMTASHGNLGSTDVDAGDRLGVPGNVGTWTTTLLPIPIKDEGVRALVKRAKGWDDIPGRIGVMAVLMEEDSLPDGAEVAGYNAMLRTFELTMNQQIPNLGLVQQNLPDTFEADLKVAVDDAVKGAILDVLSLPDKLAAWLAGPDQLAASGSWTFNHDRLAAERTISFEARTKQGVSTMFTLGPLGPFVSSEFVTQGLGSLISSGGEWIIRGNISVA
jgi:hypothetical protein